MRKKAALANNEECQEFENEELLNMRKMKKRM